MFRTEILYITVQIVLWCSNNLFAQPQKSHDHFKILTKPLTHLIFIKGKKENGGGTDFFVLIPLAQQGQFYIGNCMGNQVQQLFFEQQKLQHSKLQLGGEIYDKH